MAVRPNEVHFAPLPRGSRPCDRGNLQIEWGSNPRQRDAATHNVDQIVRLLSVQSGQARHLLSHRNFQVSLWERVTSFEPSRVRGH